MRLASWLPLTLVSLSALASACESDSTSDDLAATEGGDGDGDGDGDVEFVPIPARGDISLTTVVVNQGVDVAIANDGVWVGPEDRNTYVVGGRDTLIRAFWEIPDDWTPRMIRARLELRNPDGETTVLEDDVMVDGPSFAGDLERSFFFALLADQFPAGVEYHMTLWEAAEGAEAIRESTTVIESPIGGLAQVGVQPEPVEMRVVVLPVVYQTADCTTDTSTITDVEEQRFINYMHEQNPVQEIIWEFRRDTPIVWDTPLTSLAQLWEPLQELRTTDAAPPNAYYYALVDTCSSGIDGAAGIAPGLAPPTKDAAYMRVSAGVWLGGDEYSYHVMVHEIGHNQGRAHIFCEGGGAAGTDPSYPYENGIISIWGFGIRLFQLHSPTATYDYMTYCSPNWPSDWTWSKTFNQIRTLTAWDYEAPSPAPEQEVLLGLLMKDGTERWWTTAGGRAPEDFNSSETISFEYDGEVIAQPTSVELLDDGNTLITAPVPRPNVKPDAATRIVNGQARAIELGGAKSWTR